MLSTFIKQRSNFKLWRKRSILMQRVWLCPFWIFSFFSSFFSFFFFCHRQPWLPCALLPPKAQITYVTRLAAGAQISGDSARLTVRHRSMQPSLQDWNGGISLPNTTDAELFYQCVMADSVLCRIFKKKLHVYFFFFLLENSTRMMTRKDVEEKMSADRPRNKFIDGNGHFHLEN